jgi:hypothetical protein
LISPNLLRRLDQNPVRHSYCQVKAQRRQHSLLNDVDFPSQVHEVLVPRFRLALMSGFAAELATAKVKDDLSDALIRVGRFFGLGGEVGGSTGGGLREERERSASSLRRAGSLSAHKRLKLLEGLAHVEPVQERERCCHRRLFAEGDGER